MGPARGPRGGLQGEQTQEEGAEAGTAWKLLPGSRWRNKPAGARGTVEGGGCGGGPSVPVPQPLCLTKMVTLVLPRGRCVGPPHPSPYANSPGTIMFSTFCRQGDSARTAHLVPRISVKLGVWRMGYTFIF